MEMKMEMIKVKVKFCRRMKNDKINIIIIIPEWIWLIRSVVVADLPHWLNALDWNNWFKVNQIKTKLNKPDQTE